ncbi:MAG: CpsD/CapB family tyrosine-protein kinase [Candidatus Brocadiales bacterium]
MPNSLVAESFRSIRTHLLFSSPDVQLRTLIITAARAEEGKTFTTLNLGTAIAQAGKSVLLVEADMRRPSFSKLFSLGTPGKTFGLSSLVMKRCRPEEVIIKMPKNDHMAVLPCGPKPPNPSELLSSKSMDAVIAELRERFDIVLMDCPPVLGLADARVLSTKVDGCLVVIRHHKTSLKDVTKTKESIQAIGGRIVGAILNRVKPEPFGYYYGGYPYYSYHHDEAKEGKKKGVKKRFWRKKTKS